MSVVKWLTMVSASVEVKEFLSDSVNSSTDFMINQFEIIVRQSCTMHVCLQILPDPHKGESIDSSQ